MAALDWTNFTPNRIPKSPVNKENLNTSVPPDTEVSGDPTEITTGPKKVFKRGYPTGQSVEIGASGGKGMLSKNANLLTAHGVADGSQICQVLHPKGMSLLQSIANQKALLVTNDFKVIDIAAHEWPINLESAVDVRANLKASVKYGDEIGVVAGVSDDCVMIRVKAGDLMVAIQDLEPAIDGETISELVTPVHATDTDNPYRFTFEYKGYKYVPVYDDEPMMAEGEEGVTKIFHDVITPDGKGITISMSPYTKMTKEAFESWVDKGAHPASPEETEAVDPVTPTQPSDKTMPQAPVEDGGFMGHASADNDWGKILMNDDGRTG